MWLIVGLGNYKEKYEKTRHNIGFMAVDALAEAWGAQGWKTEKDKHAQVASAQQGEQKILFVKPHTFMNLSGSAVAPLMAYYKVKLENILVLHDDLELAQGKLRLKFGGGHRGHNGLRHIIQQISGEFWRVRIGIGRPEHHHDPAEYVLEPFTPPQWHEVHANIHRLVEALPVLWTEENPTEAFATQIEPS